MSIRLAKIADLDATSRIVTQAYRSDPLFMFYVPRAAEFPEDARTAIKFQHQNVLLKDSIMFTVIEIESPAPGLPKQIVGLATWHLTPGQPCRKRPNSRTFECAAEWEDRSMSDKRVAMAHWVCGQFCAKHFRYPPHMQLVSIAVDPEYTRRGYGTMLCKYRMNIAAVDRVPVGVAVTQPALPFFRAVGFAGIGDRTTVADGRVGKEASVRFWAYRWKPDAS